jgi:hypothetical protein
VQLVRSVSTSRLRRLAEELEEEGVDLEVLEHAELVLDELDYAMRPPVHERRIPTYGAFVEPTVEPQRWEEPTSLRVTARETTERADDDARRYADGRASWVVRTGDGVTGVVVFDRAAGSERDLVVLAHASGATLVQRDPTGTVRIVGPFGVARRDRVRWHLEPPIGTWLNDASAGLGAEHTDVLDHLLQFAVHDLGARNVGALLVYRPSGEFRPSYELREPAPPPLDISRPSDLAPLYHVLTQVDGAAVFDSHGVLRKLGVRLVPSTAAEVAVDPLGGTRHTAARRYSFDDTAAIVVAVSEDGPVTVIRGGAIVGRSPDV